MAAPDETIKMRIVQQLYWDSRVDGSKINVTVHDGAVVLDGFVSTFLERNSAVDADSVGVKVENGLVTLTGTVENWGTKTAAFFSALYTNGVIHLDDRLTVKRL